MSERTAVYRLFAGDGRLLYVGMTRNPARRFTAHAADKPWWPEVATRAVEWRASWDEAHAVEKAAIRAEKPAHNQRHALTVEQEKALAVAVASADRARSARAERDAASGRIWGLALELRRSGFKDLDICVTLGLSRATLNRKYGSRREADEA